MVHHCVEAALKSFFFFFFFLKKKKKGGGGKDKDRNETQEPAHHIKSMLYSITLHKQIMIWGSYLSALIELTEDLGVVIQTVSWALEQQSHPIVQDLLCKQNTHVWASLTLYICIFQYVGFSGI